MRRKSLPEPDFLDFTLPEHTVAVVTDDGTEATPAVVRALAGLEWKVVVLNFPAAVVGKVSALPASASRISLADMSEEELQRGLNEIAQKHGAIAAFIHVHPPSSAELNGSIHFPEADRALVRQVFLAAKHLKEPLNQAARQSRSIFMAVARLDGAFGLSGKMVFNPVSAGLFGLVKTLNLEWEPVFCRVLDISPLLDASQLATNVIAELHDPNRLVTEVAYDLEGRSTLVVETVVGGRVSQ